MAYTYNGKLTGDKDPWAGEEHIPGLYYDERKNVWRPRITYQGKPKQLGTYKTREEARTVLLTERARIQATDPTWPNHAPRKHRKKAA